MKSLKLCWVIFPLVLLSNATDLLADENHVWSEVKTLSKSKPVGKNGGSIVGDSEESIAKSFVAKKKASVRQLILILRNKKLSISARTAAANMLGAVRAIEAIDDLFEELLLSLQPLVTSDKGGLEHRFPCYAALCQIGKPASRKALVLLRLGKNKDHTDLLRKIIFKVEGKDVATFLVKAEIEKAKDKKVRARLKSTLKEFGKWRD